MEFNGHLSKCSSLKNSSARCDVFHFECPTCSTEDPWLNSRLDNHSLLFDCQQRHKGFCAHFVRFLLQHCWDMVPSQRVVGRYQHFKAKQWAYLHMPVGKFSWNYQTFQMRTLTAFKCWDPTTHWYSFIYQENGILIHFPFSAVLRLAMGNYQPYTHSMARALSAG